MTTHEYKLNETPIKKEPAKVQKPSKVKRKNYSGCIPLMVLVLVVLYLGVMAITKYFNTYTYVFHTPIEIRLFKPIVREKRKPVEVLSPLVNEILSNNGMTDLTPIEQLILDIFGVKDYKVARAIAKCESNFNCDAINVNTNGTVDYGVFQINSIHWKRFGGLKNLVTCEQQVRAAYEIYKEQGANPWVATGTKCFVGELKW